MTVEAVQNIASDALWTIIISSAPLLLISMVVGLIISIFQTITSIQEQTLTFVPKMLGIFLTLMICGGWILNNLVAFTKELFGLFSTYVNM